MVTAAAGAPPAWGGGPSSSFVAAAEAPAAVVVSRSSSSGSSSSGLGAERKLGCKWSAREDEYLRRGVASVGECNWDQISLDYLGGERSAVQCSHRWQKVLRPGLVKGPWTKEEDDIIIRYRHHHEEEWGWRACDEKKLS